MLLNLGTTYLIDYEAKRGKLMNHSNIPTEIQQKLQISLPDQRIEPNDKLTKCIFQMDDEVVKARCMNVVEIRNKGSPAKVTTLVTFISELLEKFDPHDREVALACFSLHANKNLFVTDEQIYRVMIGNSKARLRQAEAKRIEQSLIRLMGTIVRIDLSGLRKMKYETNQSELVGAILPAQFLTNVKINNSSRTVVKFLGESPVVTVAKIKSNQLITYETALADVGGRNSPDLIALKNYVLRRITECKRHRQLTPTITFDDVFQKNELSTKSKAEKKRYRDFLLRCFAEWQSINFISTYEMKKKGTGYHGISFQVSSD